MRITIDSGLRGAGTPLDIEAVPGATLAEILACADARASHAWCGAERLAPEHRAGAHPLLHGALLTARPAEPSVAPRGPHVAVVAGPDAGAVFPLDEPVTVGRGDADLVLADPALSRRHARIEARTGHAVVTDLGSVNGVAPNGSLTVAARRTVRLAEGEAVRLGDSVLVVRGLAVSADGRSARPERHALDAAGRVLSALASALSARGRRSADGHAWRSLDPTSPGSAPARASVAVVGEGEARTALARAEILARGRRPPRCEDVLDEAWLAWLPAARPEDGGVVLARESPPWADRVLRTRDAAVAVSARRAELAARRAASLASSRELPASVRWADLAACGAPEPEGLLATALGSCAGDRSPGPAGTAWMLDLDAHGPHALVAGDPGTGRTTALVTAVLALALTRDPTRLRVAAIDLAGGALAGGLKGVPHLVGLVDRADPAPALEALSAEVAARAARLGASGCASFRAWEETGGAPARLLVAIDEFHALAAWDAAHREALARLASAAGAVGVHLLLATSRPTSALDPDVRASIGTVIALRVGSEAASRDLIGTADAARLPEGIPGRAVVACAGRRCEVQLATPVATPSPRVRVIGRRVDEETVTLAQEVRSGHRDAPPVGPLWAPRRDED